MLDGVSGYIKNIAFFLIFASFIGIILPVGKYKKYIDVVLGFVLIIITVEPVAAFVFGGTRPFDKTLNEITASLDYGITVSEDDVESREKLITESFGQRIRPQLESIVSGYNFFLEDFGFSVNIEKGELEHLELYVSETPAKATSVPFIRVEKVKAGRTENVETAETLESGDIIKLKNSIADFYNTEADNIHITILKKN